MKLTRVAGLVAGLVLCLPASAMGADVSIRVEGDADTLIPRTRVSTPAQVKGGANPCNPASAAGALDVATGGDWAGTWTPGQADYFVDRIRSESHTAATETFWYLWVNGRPSQTGICNAGVSSGDEVLFYPGCYGVGCTSPVPLSLSAPRAAVAGKAFKVTVTELQGDGANVQPAVGATVSTGSATFTTGADGSVEIPARTRDITLRATKAGRLRSATETVCVTSGVDGRCGSPLDRAAPQVRVFTPKHDRRTYRRGPRRLAGGVSADASGLRHVKLRLNRTHNGRCHAYGSRAERFRRVSCGEGWWFSIGDDERWSYLLPERLPAGRYVLQAVAIDGSGNRSRVRTGSNRVKFRVR